MMLDSRPGSISISSRVTPSMVTVYSGYSVPSNTPVLGLAGQIGAPGVAIWDGCMNDVVTMYSRGDSSAVTMITANSTRDALARYRL